MKHQLSVSVILSLILSLIVETWSVNHKYTIIELRHDCSVENTEHARTIVRQLWTTVVFRLREPLYDKCKGKMNTTILEWQFDMIRRKPCRAMIGCHSLESRFDPNSQRLQYDFNVQAFRIAEQEPKQTSEINEKHNRQYWNLERPDESVGLKLEYKSNMSLSKRLPAMICFAWCNSDLTDDAPIRVVNESIAAHSPVDVIIRELEAGALNVQALVESKEPFVASPVTVYHLANDLRARKCDKDGICRVKFTFEWLNPEAVCMSNFVCTKLEGPICATYGLRFHQVTREGMVLTNESICEPNELFSGTIGAGQLAVVELWYSQPIFNAECYFWCTPDGNLPKPPKAPSNYILPNDQNDFQWFGVVLGPTEEFAVTISPFIMYNVTIAPEIATKSKCTEDLCWSKSTFTWLSYQSCSGKLVCKNLRGNVCANYGIVVTQHLGKITVGPDTFCIESDMVEFQNVSRNDAIDIEFWHHHTSSYVGAIPDNIQCYLWCTTSGLEPAIRQLDSNIDISKNINALRPIIDGQGMSPHLIYYFNDSYASQGDCNHPNGKCLSVYTIVWYHSYPGAVSVTCPNLTGNICGEYAIGVVVKNATSNQGTTICERGSLVKQGIEPGGKIMIYISNDPVITATFKCFVWTQSANEPVPQLQKLSYMEFGDPSRKIEPLQNGEYISPTKVYSFSKSFLSNPCSTKKCTDMTKFKWAYEKPCLFKMSCSKLEGNICGDFAVQIGSQNSSMDVCFSNLTYEQIVRSEGYIQLWSTKNNDYSVDCTVWCETRENFHTYKTGPNISLQNFMDFNVSMVDVDGRLSEAFVLSPYHVYNMTIDSPPCSKKKCETNLTLDWVRRETTCILNLVCKELPGNICGDYGLQVASQKGNQSSSMNVCYSSFIFEERLDSSTSLSLSLWRMSQVKAYAECFFWCEGNLPFIQRKRAFINTDKFVIERAEFGGQPIVVSPIKIYQFSGLSGPCMQTDKPCSKSIHFVQHFKPEINFNLICQSVGQGACGSYGLKETNSSTEICFADTHYSFRMTRHLSMDLWYFDSISNFECIGWISDQDSPVNLLAQEELPVNETALQTFSEVIHFDLPDSAVPISPVKAYQLHVKDLNECTDEACRATVKFTWHWEDPCEATIYCSSLKGNICGEYGLEMSADNSSSIDVCQEKVFYRFLLDSEARLSLWYVNKQFDFDTRCYFWCQNDLAAKFWNTSLDTTLLIDLQKRTKHIINMEHVPQLNFSLGLSPVRLYHLNTSGLVNIQCNTSSICFHDFKFHWHGDEACQLSLICSHLGNHVCADHGLTMKILQGSGDLNKLHVCHSDQIYEAHIDQTTEFNIQLWHINTANADMSCYVWCEDTDHEFSFEKGSQSTLNISQAAKVEILDMTEYSNELPISSVTTYLLTLSAESLPNCSEQICQLSRRMAWYSPKACEFNMMCQELSGNICGDYGYRLKAANQTTSLCRPDQTYTSSISSKQIVTIDFWYSQDVGNFTTLCYLWCSLPTGLNYKSADTVMPDLPKETLKFKNEKNYITYGIEPQVLYEISLTWADEACTSSDICTQHSNLAWLQSQSCLLNIVCPKLTGDACSLAGIIVELNETANYNLCFENSPIRLTLSAHDKIHFTFWQTPIAIFNFECYAWCDNYSELKPSRSWPQQKYEVQRTLHISPTNQNCLQGFCKVKHEFVYRGDDLCLATFTCKFLDQSACEMFGIEVKFPDAEMANQISPVCSANSVKLGALSPNKSVEIDVWFGQERSSSIHANCNLWCANKPFERPLSPIQIQNPSLEVKAPKAGIVQPLDFNAVYKVSLTQSGSRVDKFKAGLNCSMSYVKCPVIPNGQSNCEKSGMIVVYKLTNIELRQKVCLPNYVYRQKLSKDATLISILWLSGISEETAQIECFIWCTQN